MQRIGGRRLEIEPLIERPRHVVLGVNHKRPGTGNVGHLQRPQRAHVAMLLEPATLDFGYTFVSIDPDGRRPRVCSTGTTNVT